MNWTIRQVTLAVLLLIGSLIPSSAEARKVVKMATLVPEGSVWDVILRDMGQDWKEDTGGEVQLRLYPGGVAGDEPDIVRKMRVGQLHAAALSTAGMTAIDSSFEVFEIPMFFDSYDELFYVLDKLRHEFEKRVEARGYVMLNWGQGGWVHLFSKKPIRSVDDLRQQKLFSWAGNEAMIQLWRKNEFQAVPLAATEILTSLQTGIIEVVPTTPLAALSLQWFRQTPYMQDLGLAPLVGATVVSHRLWNKLSAEEQKAMRRAAAKVEKRLREDVPQQDREAVEQMGKRSLNVVAVDEAGVREWREAAAIFTKFKHENMEDQAILDLATAARDEFRAANPSAN